MSSWPWRKWLWWVGYRHDFLTFPLPLFTGVPMCYLVGLFRHFGIIKGTLCSDVRKAFNLIHFFSLTHWKYTLHVTQPRIFIFFHGLHVGYRTHDFFVCASLCSYDILRCLLWRWNNLVHDGRISCRACRICDRSLCPCVSVSRLGAVMGYREQYSLKRNWESFPRKFCQPHDAISSWHYFEHVCVDLFQILLILPSAKKRYDYDP